MKHPFTIALVGLGLIGGSLALALRGFRGARIVGCDTDEKTLAAALQNGAIDTAAASPEAAAAEADLLIFCTSPHLIMAHMRACAPFLRPGTVVSDVCGVKAEMVAQAEAVLPETVHYMGFHPMAGKEVGGFSNAEGALFRGAGFIIIPPARPNADAHALICELCEYVGAGRIITQCAAVHDAVIAYSSDLMHIAATALCARYPAEMTMAHTAGAYRDCTRIANIDPALWTDLLQDNAACILPHLDAYIDSLCTVRAALAAGDRQSLYRFLDTAQKNKKEVLAK